MVPRIRVNENRWFTRRNPSPVVSFIAVSTLILWAISSVKTPVYFHDLSKSLATPMMDLRQGEVSFSIADAKGVKPVEVSYYQCGTLPDRTRRPMASHQIILLHGARFTKEDWRTSGIMEDLCQQHDPGFYTVTALDLPVSSSYRELQQVLEALQKERLVHLPVRALVTPSASGFALTSWIQSQEDAESDHGNMQDFFQTWVPVAAGSVLKLTDEDWKRFSKSNHNIDVLAIHGDRDHMGKESSELLMTQISPKNSENPATRIIELPGGHPCYLDSPRQFVDTLRNYLH